MLNICNKNKLIIKDKQIKGNWYKVDYASLRGNVCGR